MYTYTYIYAYPESCLGYIWHEESDLAISCKPNAGHTHYKSFKTLTYKYSLPSAAVQNAIANRKIRGVNSTRKVLIQ